MLNIGPINPIANRMIERIGQGIFLAAWVGGRLPEETVFTAIPDRSSKQRDSAAAHHADNALVVA
jgi:hypothetical protein